MSITLFSFLLNFDFYIITKFG
ncbi:hypothetical protein ACQ27_gp013 [Klebsiella phage K64-1]|nr:hypothetical protein ACQ27_gp013 [Klebsiella phage K64-1]